MKKRVSFLTLLLVLCLTLPNSVTSQAVGWSDDFDDGNIDNWTVYGWNRTSGEELPGNFNADDHTLRAYDEESSKAYHTSNVANGSWIFDIECVPTPSNHSYVAFVSSPSSSLDMIPREYGLMTVVGEFGAWDHAFVLYRRNIGNPNIIPLGTYDVTEVSGWHHINITRTPSGDFTVSFNGTIGITASETGYTTSDIFAFYCEAGLAIDNIVVTPYSETTSPTTPPPNGVPSDLTIILIIGGGLAGIVVIAIIIRSKK